MKKIPFSLSILLILAAVFSSTALAQGMPALSEAEEMNWTGSQSGVVSDDHTAREEQEGKEIWAKLQAKQVECKDLTNDNFESLGEYFMGQSIGNTQRHELMNQMMTNMMGQNAEEQMHIALGKRSSGCDTNALSITERFK